jgi:hypothetical protein
MHRIALLTRVLIHLYFTKKLLLWLKSNKSFNVALPFTKFDVSLQSQKIRVFTKK